MSFAAHPIRSEMAGATPKHQAKEPIGFDVVFVCRKLQRIHPVDFSSVCENATAAAEDQLLRLLRQGFHVSLSDIRLLVLSHSIRLLSTNGPAASSFRYLETFEPALEETALELGKLRAKSIAHTA